MKKGRRKLVLSRETLCNLERGQVAGGLTDLSCPQTCTGCTNTCTGTDYCTANNCSKNNSCAGACTIEN